MIGSIAVSDSILSYIPDGFHPYCTASHCCLHIISAVDIHESFTRVGTYFVGS